MMKWPCSAVPISRGHCFPNNSWKTYITRPLWRGMGVFGEFEIWTKVNLRSLLCWVQYRVILYRDISRVYNISQTSSILPKGTKDSIHLAIRASYCNISRSIEAARYELNIERSLCILSWSPYCWSTRQISWRYDNYNMQSRGFETSRSHGKVDGIEQDCNNSFMYAMGILRSSSKPSKCCIAQWMDALNLVTTMLQMPTQARASFININ